MQSRILLNWALRMSTYLDHGSRFIPTQYQPALIAEFAFDREVPDSVLFKHTRLNRSQLLDSPGLITAQDTLQLIINLSKHLQTPDVSFLLGQLCLPGHFGALSQALMHAPHLEGALQLVVNHQALLSPLLVPHLAIGQRHAVLYWTDAFGTPAQRNLLVEMAMSSVHAMSRWLGGRAPDWTYCFNRPRPRELADHEVHLGPRLRFDCLIDGIVIETPELRQPWPRGSDAGLSVAMNALQGMARPVSWLSALYDHLLENIRHAPSLEDTADHFGISPATLKRHLARMGTHFQAELDMVRMHVTLQLFHDQDFDNEEAARYLGFHDAANFRRSFKRWTGLTPQLLKADLLRHEPPLYDQGAKPAL